MQNNVKINTPVTGIDQHNVHLRPTKEPPTPNLIDPSKVVAGTNTQGSQATREDQNLGLLLNQNSVFNRFIGQLAATPGLSQTLKKVMFEAFLLSNSTLTKSSEVNNLLAELASELKLNPDEIVEALKYQNDNHTKFGGKLFDALRELQKQNANNKQFENLLGRFLKAYNGFFSVDDTLKAIITNLNQIKSQIPRTHATKLDSIIAKLVVNPELSAPASGGEFKPFSNAQAPHLTGSQTAGAQYTQSGKATTSGLHIAPDGTLIAADQPVMPDGTPVPQGMQLMPDGTLAQPMPQMPNAAPNPQRAPLMPNGLPVPDGLQLNSDGSVSPQVTQVLPDGTPVPDGMLLTPDGRLTKAPPQGTHFIPAAKPTANNQQTAQAMPTIDPEVSLEQNLAVLKNEVIPFMSHYLGVTNDFGKVRDVITLLVNNIARLNTSSRESIIESFVELVDFCKFNFDMGPKEIEEIKQYFSQQMSKLGKRPIEHELFSDITKLVAEGQTKEQSYTGRTMYREIATSLLLDNSVFMPLNHMFLPVNYNGKFMFTELWVEKDSEHKLATADQKPITRMMVNFDIKGIGFFEAIMWISEDNVDVELNYPSTLQASAGEIQDNVSKIFRKNGLKMNNIVLAADQPPRRVQDVFRNLFDARRGVDVTI